MRKWRVLFSLPYGYYRLAKPPLRAERSKRNQNARHETCRKSPPAARDAGHKHTHLAPGRNERRNDGVVGRDLSRRSGSKDDRCRRFGGSRLLRHGYGAYVMNVLRLIRRRGSGDRLRCFACGRAGRGMLLQPDPRAPILPTPFRSRRTGKRHRVKLIAARIAEDNAYLGINPGDGAREYDGGSGAHARIRRNGEHGAVPVAQPYPPKVNGLVRSVPKLHKAVRPGLHLAQANIRSENGNHAPIRARQFAARNSEIRVIRARKMIDVSDGLPLLHRSVPKIPEKPGTGEGLAIKAKGDPAKLHHRASDRRGVGPRIGSE